MMKNQRIGMFRLLCMSAKMLCMGALLLCMSASVWPQDARAQEPEDIRLAQTLFNDAVAAYKTQKYPEALALFREAYTHVPSAVFLYNAARVAEKMGDLDASLEFAKRAASQQERALPAPLAEKNSVLIKSLENQIAQTKKRAEEERVARQRAEKQIAEKQRVEKQLAEKKLAEQRRAQEERARRQGASEWSWIGYSGVGFGIAGIGLIGGATYLGAEASSEIDSMRGIDDEAIYAQKRSDVESTQTTGQVLLYSGIGLVALGGGMVAWDLMNPDESPVSVSVGAGPGDAGVSLSGEF
jgi:tetratricopeptide (TPR) repeat protein